jgi:hypothetical protein
MVMFLPSREKLPFLASIVISAVEEMVTLSSCSMTPEKIHQIIFQSVRGWSGDVDYV